MADRVGGTFAPPLTDAKIAEYEALINTLPKISQIRDIMNILLKCCKEWWKLPESKSNEIVKHASGTGVVIKLDESVNSALWDFIPWRTDIKAYGDVLDTIDPVGQKDLRNAAFHLLWHAAELELGREPITNDKL